MDSEAVARFELGYAQEMSTTKKCEFCGRFYRPDPRVGKRQRSCFQAVCQKKRRQASQKQWVSHNRDYFRNRYADLKAWRKKHADYQRVWRAKRREIQDEIRAKSPLKSIHLLVPAKVFAGEIQDEIRLIRQCYCGLWLPGAEREIQDKMVSSEALGLPLVPS